MGSAALLNGITSHTFDYDDTHLKTIIHPAGPVASAALALAEHRGATGRQFVDAIVLGIDVSCRVGNMIYPDHYDRGWHITGSTGMLGAAAACSRLLGLDAAKTAMALGIAASQPIGVREQFGSMTKSFHVGGAARAGLMSALMAQHGYTSSAAGARGAARAGADLLDQVRLERDHRRARRALRDLVQHLQAVRLRHRDPSRDRRLRAAAQCAWIARRGHRARRPQGALAGARADRQEDAAHGARGQVQRLPRLRGGHPVRTGGRGRILRRHRRPRRRDRVARPRPGERGRRNRRGGGGRRRDVQGWPQAATFWSNTRSAACSGR